MLGIIGHSILSNLSITADVLFLLFYNFNLLSIKTHFINSLFLSFDGENFITNQLLRTAGLMIPLTPHSFEQTSPSIEMVLYPELCPLRQKLRLI